MLMVALSGSIFGKNSTPLPNLAKEKIDMIRKMKIIKVNLIGLSSTFVTN